MILSWVYQAQKKNNQGFRFQNMNEVVFCIFLFEKY